MEAALREVLATTTALVVAHRPSTVLLADRVALLSGGRIAAVGTHHELLRDNAEYASLMSGDERGRADDADHARPAARARRTPRRSRTTGRERRSRPGRDRGRPDGTRGLPPRPGDPFDQDVLPAPKGASAHPAALAAARRTGAGSGLAAVLLLLQQAAVQAGPLLVAYAIDRAVPALPGRATTAR